MKPSLVVLCVACLASPLSVQARGWEPSQGNTQVPIWPPTTTAGELGTGVESTSVSGPQVDGRPWLKVQNVSVPTLTVYSPKGKNTRACLVVFPGGGYNVLAMDLEGTEICDWLTSKGITCVLLKYRVPCAKTGPYRDC